MRLYVASSLYNYKNARKTMDVLAHMGHLITFDWTLTVSFGDGVDAIRPDEAGLSIKDKVDFAFADMRGVREADAMVLLYKEESIGAFIEMGMAIERGQQIYVIGANQFTVFWALPNVMMFIDVHEFYEYLDAYGA